MAIKAITPKELQDMDLDTYTKRAQQMLNKMTGQDGKSEDLKFIFIDDYDFEKTSDLEEQPVFIAGTNFDRVWKDADIRKLEKAGYKQDIMHGECRVIDGALHMFDLDGGSIMNKDVDLKFKEYLKDMQKASVFKGWEFHEGSLPAPLEEKANDNFDRGNQGVSDKHKAEYEKAFQVVKVVRGDEASIKSYKELLARIQEKAKSLGALDDDEYVTYYTQLTKDANVVFDPNAQESVLKKVMAFFDAYENDKAEDLFDTPEDKKAADEERVRLAEEIPKLWKNLAKIYAKAEKLPKLTEDDFDTSTFEEKRKIYEELLDASGEVRSNLMDVGKFYFRLIA